MWLRDFLSKDLPYCRTMTYGYNSKLSSHGIDTIMDYSRELMEEIKKIRSKENVSTGLYGLGHNPQYKLAVVFYWLTTVTF